MKALSDVYSIRMGLGGIAVLLIGLTLFAVLFNSLNAQLPLWFFGRDVLAHVDESWVEQIGEAKGGELSFKYFIRYSFTTPEGQTFSNSTPLSATEWSIYGEGSEVLVTYLPTAPARNQINNDRYRPLIVCSLIPFAIVTLAALVIGWNLLSKGFKRLDTAPWVPG